ncbi:WXG100 family type VII secretion target [Mycolicibacterium flavescens]|uniref:ESAT-6-like protein n=1 Tax=Mycolicibacterium flavescens TaxID=1776 RepID=A0A1E3RFT7_MYCFV|nr:WXG100 family type VII secretion target [Mycolicibacterium flavescens]MCV7282821.1 WXG100 family type VII secretion target [Mycolicibacterium flavescens]ODQ88730.1 hypothetical protein BHQ18_17880 [Mycolicibacterium flavescens]
MRELRVNPSEIHRSSVEIDEITTTLTSALSASDAQIASARSGWTGKSADALASMSAGWEFATQLLAEVLSEHGKKFAAAATRYGRADESGAESVRSAAENL